MSGFGQRLGQYGQSAKSPLWCVSELYGLAHTSMELVALVLRSCYMKQAQNCPPRKLAWSAERLYD